MHFPLTVEIRTVLVSPVSPGGNHTPVSPWRPYVQRGFGLSATGGSHAEALLPCTRRQLSVKADSACGGKPHPSTHLLICCTGITPYNVIIHPDPGFVKYFLKFQHNNPAIYGTRPELPPDSSGNASYSALEQQNIFDFNKNPIFP